MNIASLSDSTHLTYIIKISSWMPPTIGHLLENIQYGMQQSQHYNFGLQISNLTSSAMPLKESTQLPSGATQHSSNETSLMQ